ncbi:MAG: hypothetical protein H6878_13355 [Rhodobiaceae bacterium]|nr:hypothetical protein [Rhodobiaceae bacterium]
MKKKNPITRFAFSTFGAALISFALAGSASACCVGNGLGGLGEGPRDPVFDVSRIYYDVHYGANGYEERDNADDEPTPPNLLDLFRLWFEAQGRPQR